MESKGNKRNIAIIAICLCLILVTGIITSVIKTDNGNIKVKEVTISPYGADLSLTMYMPDSALETDESGEFVNANSYPAVMINSGYTEDRSCLDNISIELAKRGFVVAQFDMYGHGHSDVITTRGYGNVPDPFGADMSLLGAYDVLDYLRTLGYIDQSRIGMVGHSLGGSAVGAMAATTAGFYTREDTLLNMLHDDFGIEITAEQVAEQNADAIANANLDELNLQLYEQKKAELTQKYDMGVRNMIVLDAGVGFSSPKSVEVAGNTVWRDVQANFALFANISGGLSKGISNKDYCLSSDATLQLLSQDTAVKRNTWYKLNLSSSADRVTSTEVGEFFADRSDSAIQDVASTNSLRLLVQPRGWHAFTYISGETTTAAVQFFTTVMAFDNGNIVANSGSTAAATATTSSWKIKEIVSGIAFFALISMILPFVRMLLNSRAFASLNGEPIEPVNTKVTPVLIIFALITTIVPMLLYPKGVGWLKNAAASPFSTIQIATQTAFWSFIMAAMIFVLVVVKYFAYDKKHLGVSFSDMYGLKINKTNVLKSIGLALIIFISIAGLLVLYYAFAQAKMRITPLGKIEFVALSGSQYYSYFLYALYFFPFYMINAMVTNSARFKNMSEKKNMFVIAAINCSGMLLLAVLQILFGLFAKGSPVLPTVPGTSATIYNLPFFALMLFVSAIINRNLYKKTGATLPGVLVNLAVFTFPAILSFAYFAF